jgi:hypothetical protein
MSNVLSPTIENSTGRFNPASAAQARNDQACLAAQAGDTNSAIQGFREALDLDPFCHAARFNLTFLEEALAERADGGEAPRSVNDGGIRPVNRVVAGAQGNHGWGRPPQ